MGKRAPTRRSPARQATRSVAPVAPPVVVDPAPAPAPDLGAVERQATAALLARRRAAQLEREAVELGRSGGVAWERLGRWLDVPGETLRRRYRGEVQ